MKTLIVPDLGDFSVTITPTAEQQKADALAMAATVQTVTNSKEQQDAITGAAMLKSLINGMEKTRVSVKEPVLDAGRSIDATAKQYSAELVTEAKRLEGLASAYQTELNRLAALAKAEEEARQKKLADELERQRQADLAAAAEREREANTARLRDLEVIQAAKDDEARRKAQQAADEAAEARAREVRAQELHDAEMAEHRAEEARKNAMAMQQLAAPKAEGARVKVQMDYEMVDIAALHAARPDLVNLTEKRANILAFINIPNQPPLPGIRTFESAKVQAKAL